MYYLTFITFSLIISMVPFSVALSSSVYRCIQWKEALKIAVVFALAQAVMAAAGWGLGALVKDWFKTLAVPVALFIMVYISIRLFMESRRPGRELRIIAVESNRIMLGFAFVTGINTLLVSISLGILYIRILDYLWILALAVFFFTAAGIRAGKMGWAGLGRTLETLASAVLFLSAVFILVQYLKLI